MLILDETQRAGLAVVCRRYGFARLDVFGSVARGEETPDSDVDVLYELVPGRHIGWEIDDATEDLAAVLGRPVDLIARRAVHPLLRERITAEAIALYAA
ncbi:nucleotidyltransferase family protein [Actinotalea sp. C106]|uniref:nucleotidyltransferase family protein n=1 Tax=Actinotalea sp. C106 TaxID=2908644 RepID=UPI002027B179|nr:nucleotidyltransferase family protein [Actinotalea sp. C106]